MRRPWIRTAAVLLIAVFCQAAAAQKAPRLVVDNRTKQAATIQVWRYTGYHWDWLTVATVPAGRWVPVTDIKNGERFRVKDTAKTRVVNLRNDPGYGGPQDVWVLQ